MTAGAAQVAPIDHYPRFCDALVWLRAPVAGTHKGIAREQT